MLIPSENILTQRAAQLKACHFKIGLRVALDLRFMIAAQTSSRSRPYPRLLSSFSAEKLRRES